MSPKMGKRDLRATINKGEGVEVDSKAWKRGRKKKKEKKVVGNLKLDCQTVLPNPILIRIASELALNVQPQNRTPALSPTQNPTPHQNRFHALKVATFDQGRRRYNSTYL